MHLDDVIIAVASPPGRSARGIIRMSGAKTLALLEQHVVELQPTRGMHVTILSSGLHSKPSEKSRRERRCPCMLLLFPDEHSYTGEPAAEIQLPGNPDLVDGYVDAIIEGAGAHDIDARRAEPGEFTARAFMNGRLDLTEAEGVAATISAQSDAALEAARMLTDGTLGDLALALADRLAGALALVEAGIDFTDEEDVVPIAPRVLAGGLHEIREQLEMILERSTGIEAIEAIPCVVLWGPPNAGKSTLFNALLGRERTIVSPVAGTTRDVIREPMTIDTPAGPAEILLVDVAGHEDVAPSETLHTLVQEAGRAALRQADLLLLCGTNDSAPPPSVPGAVIRVATKCDVAPSAYAHDVAVSSMHGTGLDELRRQISVRLADSAVRIGADQIGLRPRHDEALRAASSAIADALSLFSPTDRRLEPAELVAAHMRTGLDALAALAGDVSPDDVLGRIFASFCIGK